MLTILIGRGGTGKTTAMLRRICQEGEHRPQVLLVPEQASHEMERRLCAQGGNRVSLFAEVLSFTRLANRVSAQAGGLAQPVLDSGGRMLLLYRAIQSVAHRLKVYGKPSRRPAFLSGMLATVDELKSYCIPLEELSRVGEEQGGLQGDKLQDLALICGTYDALLAGGTLDPRDRLNRLAQQLEDCEWGQGIDLYIDGFTDFTTQEERVIRGMLRRAHQVTVALACDRMEETDGDNGVFSAARRTIAGLRRLAEQTGAECRVEVLEETRRFAPESPLAFLERNLFTEGTERQGTAADALKLFAASTPRSEVEWTAAEIRGLLQSGKYRLRDIGVAARSMTAYGHLLETVFRRYDIPLFLSTQSDILSKPVMTLVVSALEIAARGYEYDGVFRYLKTGLTDLGEEDRDLLENYALKWDIRGGKWTGPDWTMHPDGYGRKWTEGDEARLARLNAARRQVTGPLERLRKNPNRTGRGQAMAFYTFLEEIELPARLEERTAWFQAQGDLTLAEEYAQLWDILCGALEQCAGLLRDTPVEQEEFSRLLQLVLSQYSVGTIPVSLDRVTAGEMPRIVNREVKVLFLLGAHDGAIPARAESAGLLTDEDRDLLADYGMRLAPRMEEKLCREMTIVYASCAQPSEKLYLTWPSAGSAGEEYRPSFLVHRLTRLFPDCPVEHEGALDGSFRRAAPRAAAEQAGRDPALQALLKEIPGQRPLMERLERAEEWKRGSLSPRTVSELYGSRIPMSASRLDRYKACHFSYFMKFGLKAQPRTPAGFNAPEYGTFVHDVLERVLTAAKEEGGPAALTEERRKELTHQAVERYISEELGGLEGQTPRFQYLFRRLQSAVDQVVRQVVEELAASKFQPISFELGFGKGEAMPPVEFRSNGVTVSITGFVDRVDGWVHDGKLYLRVVDYKTGRKTFDLTEIWNGMGLQMLLYLFTLEEQGKTLYDRDVVPAGVLYLPAREALVAGSGRMTEAERQKAVDRQLRRHGLLLDDPEVLGAMEQAGEQGIRFLPIRITKTGAISGDSLVSAQRLGRLKRHTEQILKEVCHEMAVGKITADPYWRGEQKNACLYCDYYAACHFEEGRGGDCKRWLPKVDGKEFWARLERAGEDEPQ